MVTKDVMAIKELSLEEEIVDVFKQFGEIGHVMEIRKLKSELGKRKVKYFDGGLGIAVNNMINNGNVVVKRIDPASLVATHIALVKY